MKKRIISFILMVTLIGAMVYSVSAGEETTTKKVNGENWEDASDFGANITMATASGANSGSYTLGDYFEFKSSTYCAEAENKIGEREFLVQEYTGEDDAAVADVQYKDGQEWKDISGFNTEISFKNDINRYFRVKFLRDGIYVITNTFRSQDGPMFVQCVPRYLIIKDGTYSMSKKEPLTYEVSDFKSGDEYTYPKKKGYIFAGWYADEKYETVYTQTTGSAYARFIDERVLSVKFQEARDEDNKITAVRFVSTMDHTDYKKAGFIFSGTYGDRTISLKDRNIKCLYYSIKANGQTAYPSDEFGAESKYFFTYTIRELNGISSTWSVAPYFVTPDGTMVTGKNRTHTAEA